MARPKVHPKTLARIRREVYTRDAFTCQVCGWTAIVPEDWNSAYTLAGENSAGIHVSLELDHVLPFSRGGKFTLDNLQTLCNRCNCRKGSKV